MKNDYTKIIFIILGISVVIMLGLICNQSKDVKKEVKNNQIPKILDTLPAAPAPVFTFDSNLVKKMKPLFRTKKDEYTGLVYYHHKSSPAYVNRNGVFCYIIASGNLPEQLRICIQYLADDWLFIRNYTFLIDGVPYEYEPKNIERDNGEGGIWEWSDEKITMWEKELINALRVAKKVKIKFDGSQYYKEKVVTADQLKAIRDVCNMYEAMGGGVLLK